MLESIDQWALSVLMMLFNIMGVQDVPREPDVQWQVVERWSEIPGEYYRLVIASEQVAENCRRDPHQFVVFPQTYMGQQEIYADDLLVYTNSLDEKWKLGTVFDRPALSCHLFQKAKVVKLQTDSYLKFFASINSWPYLTPSYPRDQIFFNIVYLLSGVLAITITLIGSIVLFMLGSIRYAIINMGLSIFLLMIAHVPGYILGISLDNVHIVLLISTLSMCIFFSYEKLIIKLTAKRVLSIAVITTVLLLISYRYKNSNQLLMIIIPFFILILLLLRLVLVVTYFEVKNKSQRVEYLILSLFSVLALYDLYRTQFVRVGYLNLTLIVLGVLILEFIKVQKELYASRMNLISAEVNLNSEKKISDKISNTNSLLKEIVHDLKSPMTTLNFLANADDFDRNVFSEIVLRMGRIFDKFSEKSGISAIDWYSVDLLMLKLDKLIIEKQILCKSISKMIEIETKNINVFVDPEEFLICIAELIDNAVKSNLNMVDIKINASIDESENFLKIKVINSGHLDNVKSDGWHGLKGASVNGTGYGLYGIQKKVKEWGGDFQVESSDQFTGIIYIKLK